MTAKELNSKLLEIIPETKTLFDFVTHDLEGLETGSTIVVEDVFMVYLKDSLKQNNVIALNKCRSFIEWLSDYIDDEYAGEVLVICIFEYIHYSSDRSEFLKVLGPRANKIYNSINWN